MKRNPDRFKTALTTVLVLLSILAGLDGALASDAAGGGVTVEQVSDSEWRIINPAGEFVGSLKSESRKSFMFYDAGGTFIGTISESKAWFHRLYRKRETLVTPEEATLYLDALAAIEAIP